MIVDVTGVVLTPGNGGADCLGNGHGFTAEGIAIECCCDECDYLLCCIENPSCDECADTECPRAKRI